MAPQPQRWSRPTQSCQLLSLGQHADGTMPKVHTCDDVTPDCELVTFPGIASNWKRSLYGTIASQCLDINTVAADDLLAASRGAANAAYMAAQYRLFCIVQLRTPPKNNKEWHPGSGIPAMYILRCALQHISNALTSVSEPVVPISLLESVVQHCNGRSQRC